MSVPGPELQETYKYVVINDQTPSDTVSFYHQRRLISLSEGETFVTNEEFLPEELEVLMSFTKEPRKKLTVNKDSVVNGLPTSSHEGVSEEMSSRGGSEASPTLETTGRGGKRGK